MMVEPNYQRIQEIQTQIAILQRELDLQGQRVSDLNPNQEQ